jgi:hypothetical protein
MEIMQRIDELIDVRHLLRHPFYLQWMAGTLPAEALQEWDEEHGKANHQSSIRTPSARSCRRRPRRTKNPSWPPPSLRSRQGGPSWTRWTRFAPERLSVRGLSVRREPSTRRSCP